MIRLEIRSSSTHNGPNEMNGKFGMSLAISRNPISIGYGLYVDTVGRSALIRNFFIFLNVRLLLFCWKWAKFWRLPPTNSQTPPKFVLNSITDRQRDIHKRYFSICLFILIETDSFGFLATKFHNIHRKSIFRTCFHSGKITHSSLKFWIGDGRPEPVYLS